VTTEHGSRLAALGWDAFWANAYRGAAADVPRSAADDCAPARIVAEYRGRYRIARDDGDAWAVLAGRARHTASDREQLPAVGDWVGVSRGTDDGTVLIRFAVPRRGAFIRKTAGMTTEAQVVAANVDVALIATALPGDLSTRRLERYLTLAWESGAIPVVVLTKADLGEDVDASIAEAALAAPGADVVALSAVTGVGIDQLAAHLAPGRTAVLLGSSGVGKSTLVNRLLGDERQRTAATTAIGKGRHTTTHRELVRLANGALLIDTPGMRELQLWSADDGLESAFADVDAFANGCRFRDCVHAGEPGCAVREAVESGALSAARLEHWGQLRRELAYLARKQDERAMADARSRMKSLTKGLRSHLRDKYGGA
jgi:ribosome biogenesis GTPase